MIDKQNGKFVIVCDICGDQSYNNYDSFQDAVQGKKEEGFVSKKSDGEWQDICDVCDAFGEDDD